MITRVNAPLLQHQERIIVNSVADLHARRQRERSRIQILIQILGEDRPATIGVTDEEGQGHSRRTSLFRSKHKKNTLPNKKPPRRLNFPVNDCATATWATLRRWVGT
jgi:hypothetical protein